MLWFHLPLKATAVPILLHGLCASFWYAIIEFVRTRIDKKHASLLTVLDRLRRKRNLVLYDDTGFVSHHDAEDALEAAREYLGVIRADIAVRKP